MQDMIDLQWLVYILTLFKRVKNQYVGKQYKLF